MQPFRQPGERPALPAVTLTQTCLFVGLVLGLAAGLGGLDAFVITALLGFVGFVVGRVLDGTLDLSGLLGRGKDR